MIELQDDGASKAPQQKSKGKNENIKNQEDELRSVSHCPCSYYGSAFWFIVPVLALVYHYGLSSLMLLRFIVPDIVPLIVSVYRPFRLSLWFIVPVIITVYRPCYFFLSFLFIALF
jgi:hypothetical protein